MSMRLPMGGVFASKDPIIITTLLGSCVAACLFDPVLGIGGMNHIWLPEGTELHGLQKETVYGFPGMELLLDQLFQLGASKHAIRAKVFGGASLLRGTHPEGLGVVKMNCRFVLHFLEKEGIPIDAYRLGGTQGVSVDFHTGTGKVRVRCLEDHTSNGAAER